MNKQHSQYKKSALVFTFLMLFCSSLIASETAQTPQQSPYSLIIIDDDGNVLDKDDSFPPLPAADDYCDLYEMVSEDGGSGLGYIKIYDTSGNLIMDSVIENETAKSEKDSSWFSYFGSCLNSFKEKNSYSNYIQKDLDNAAEGLFGKGFLQFGGYYSHPLESGRSPFGEEISDKVRITLINGILNVRHDHDALLKIFSESHGDAPIHYVFRPTEGWTKDVLTSTLSKFGYTTPYAKELAATWKKLIAEMGGVGNGGEIVHYAHSIGATDTYVARNLMTSEELMMIHVITLGSPTMIPRDSGFASATNYVSKRDGVCFLDPIGYVKGYYYGHSKIELIGSHWGIPLVDHTLYTETYGGIIRELGLKFQGDYQF